MVLMIRFLCVTAIFLLLIIFLQKGVELQNFIYLFLSVNVLFYTKFFKNKDF